MSRLPLQPIRRAISLLRRADKRLFDLVIRWPTLSDDQIARAMDALDGERPVPQISAKGPSGPTSDAIALAAERLRRVKQVRQERDASRWWRRRVEGAEVSLPFASWTVFCRRDDGEWVPSLACGDRRVADEAAAALATTGVDCLLVSWEPDGQGRPVPSR